MVLLAGLALSGALPASGAVIDSFDGVSAWSVIPADGVDASVHADGGAMRLDVHFTKGGGYAVVRRAVDLSLPVNYRIVARVRGTLPPNNLELKLVDSTGANVWWYVRRPYTFESEWRVVSTKKRQVTFAWGPAGGGELRRAAALEWAVSAGEGGRGSVWFDDLVIEELPPPSAAPPEPSARATSGDASRAIDRERATAWTPSRADDRPALSLDLHLTREFGGAIVEWRRGAHAVDYDVELSDHGAAWRVVRRVRGSTGGRDYLALPEAEARHVRVTVLRAARGGCALAEIALQPLEWSEVPARVFETMARDAQRGLFPRSLRGEQIYWTAVGVDGDSAEALLSEDGQLETGKSQFSLEPFLEEAGRVWTWADASRIEHARADGALPIPTVRWRLPRTTLAVTVAASGVRGAASAVVHYDVSNESSVRRRVRLHVAARPFQVNPATQFLNTPGGVASVRTLAWDGHALSVNRRAIVAPLVAPSAVRVQPFDAGDVTESFGRGSRASFVEDPQAAASGVLTYDLMLPPRGARRVSVCVWLSGPPLAPRAAVASVEATSAAWHARLDDVRIELPAPHDDIPATVRAQLADILVNRDGPALQPGSRAYERSWIRDGALTSTALLRLGQNDVVAEFIDWFGDALYDNGKVPCCVDRRGSDPVPEHDSHGEWIYLVAEYYRYTSDRARAEHWWPSVRRAAEYLDALRHERRRTPFAAPFYGLLPPSISHEGYSAEPMHSYWDDFFALRGFVDAAWLGAALGHTEEAARLATMRDEFRADLRASLAAAMQAHRIDYVPGCADLGDFDATSTTIALDPVRALEVLPDSAAERTFEKYWRFLVHRRDGGEAWDAFTPYEWRAVGSFVRLGWRDRARQAHEWLMTYRRPLGWRHWAEVARRDARAPGFIGDMPHTWVGSDFIRSTLDMLAYEDDADSSLVIGAGVPDEWLAGEGVRVSGLHTTYGPLSFRMTREGEYVDVAVDGGVRVPRGGVVVRLAGTEPHTLRSLPARARLRAAPAGE
jgi:hypothetical protein